MERGSGPIFGKQKTSSMNKRIFINDADPEAYQVMMGFEKYFAHIRLTPLQKELIKIRTSQINGCTYCIDKHTRDARRLGETEQRLYTLSNWRETPFFTEEEQALLALTEEVTLIANGGVSEATYTRAAALFDEQQLAQIIMLIIGYNAWNRIGVSTHMQPAAVPAL